jgi:hypothetical protein
MNVIRYLIGGVTFACVAASVPTCALDFGPDSLKAYGGTYSPACGNPSAPRARVAADAIMVEARGKRMTGHNLQDAVSYFGPEPPPNYETTLLGEVRGGQGLMFVMYRDESGQYLEIQGDNKVMAALKTVLGKAMETKFRDCNPELHRVSTPSPVPAAPVSDVWDPLQDKKFQSLYHRALGAKRKVSWLATLSGPMSQVREVNVEERPYKLIAVCKAHDCYDNSMVMLYSAPRGVVYGKIYESGRTVLVGKPSPAVVVELERLWKAEWRQQ